MAQVISIEALDGELSPETLNCSGDYLLHFATPYKHAKHYLGYAELISARIEHHRAGSGARLMEVIREAGIEFAVVRIWKNGTRKDERALKNRKNAPKLCPVCRQKIAKKNGAER